MKIAVAAGIVSSCVLAACVAPPPPNPAELVPADVIINTIKCEVAQLVTDLPLQTPRRVVLLGQDFTVNLKLKAVIKTTAGIDADGSLDILAFNGITPAVSLGASVVGTSTVDTTTDFTLNGTAENAKTCLIAKQDGRILQNGIGYYVFMRQLANDVNRFVVGDPKIIADQFKYDATFGVTSTGKGSVKYGFVPLSVKGSVETTLDNVQQVTITVKNSKASSGGAVQQLVPPSGSNPPPSQPCAGQRCLPPAIPFGHVTKPEDL
ncbi:hypothetical protein J2X65_001052 [Ancylobacter sp. 3268]|uniref:hypothetical protein n=1 Tax=Ancylobacter sp. 3268 TaxID=2817752 RepID=UPI002864C180|nr:hypothetical protein [Ancylobacter sp. 3268]MDR6951703.1 hypothetical protein [Ancylobacter sp. 3268]